MKIYIGYDAALNEYKLNTEDPLELHPEDEGPVYFTDDEQDAIATAYAVYGNKTDYSLDIEFVEEY